MDILGSGIGYQGETPFATCFMQAMACVATERGVPQAIQKLGPSWGFLLPESNRLHGGGRWLDGMAATTGLRLSWLTGASWGETACVEREVLDKGGDLIVAVDSFDVPSPYFGTEHLVHAVIVVKAGDDHVVVTDMMNDPDPRPIPMADYARSRMSAVADGLALLCEPGPARPVDAELALALLAGEVRRHRTELEVLSRFVEEVTEGDGMVDVSEAAAERLALSQVLAGLAGRHGWLGAAADSMRELSRRWYLLHLMVREATRGGTSLRPARLSRMVRDLHTREAELNEWFADRMSPEEVWATEALVL